MKCPTIIEQAANTGLRNLLQVFPRSRRLYNTCAAYVAQNEGDGDALTNGEYAFVAAHLPACKVVFDVGANVGGWARMALAVNPKIQLHCFEPSVSTFKSLEGNAFPGAVTYNNFGLSSVPSRATLHVFAEGSGWNSLYRRNGLEALGSAPPSATEDVTLTTLDGYCVDNGVTAIDFLKLDVEGHELDALKGAGAMLRAGQIKRIQFEYGGTNIDARTLLKDFHTLLEPLGYTIFKIAPEGLVKVPGYDVRLEDFKYKNFAALHASTLA